MKLMTEEVKRKLPPMGSQESKAPTEVMVTVKFFDPCGRFTFYATEYDGEDSVFGYCVSPLGPDCDELGYASVSELQAVRGRLGLGIERDIHWTPKTLAEVMKEGR